MAIFFVKCLFSIFVTCHLKNWVVFFLLICRSSFFSLPWICYCIYQLGTQQEVNSRQASEASSAAPHRSHYCLNHPPLPPFHGKIVFHETSPWCQKGWGPLVYMYYKWLFLFLMVSFDGQKFLIWTKSKLSIFSFMVKVFCVLLWNLYPPHWILNEFYGFNYYI